MWDKKKFLKESLEYWKKRAEFCANNSFSWEFEFMALKNMANRARRIYFLN